MNKQRIRNLIFFGSLIIIVFVSQFILAKKHLEYGFNNDDWYALAWYKQVVGDPILDMVKAWREIGAHNFSHAYYIGTLFEFLKFNYPLYHVFNTVLKALAGISLLPVIYLLFKNKFLAFLITFLFAIHFTPFGGLNNVLIGEDSLVIVSMNIFLAIYIWAAQKHNFNLKRMFVLLVLLLAASYFDITRFYPVLLLLPFLELFSLWLNRSSTTFKASLFRLLFLYFPFIAVVLYSPQAAISEVNINKLTGIFNSGNYQLFVGLFASFGSTFIPQGLIGQITLFGRVGINPLYQDIWTFLNFLLFRFLILGYPILVILGLLTTHKSRGFILRSLFLSICFSILAFMAANHWVNLDPKIKAAVEPGVYFIPGIIGLFVFATAISFLIEWFKNKQNYFLLALSLAPLFSLFYTFLTWILVQDENTIFMGVHGYLSIAAIGSSVYLAILFYLAFRKLRFGPGIIRKIAGNLTILYFLLFIILSAQQINRYYSDWLVNGYAASDQKRIHNSFWREVGKGKSDGSPILIYLDGSGDDGFFYSANFTWDIPPMLTVEKGQPFDPGGHCKSVISAKDADKLRVEGVSGKKMIVQDSCGYDISYELETFFAFRMVERNLIPIRNEILKDLGVDSL